MTKMGLVLGTVGLLAMTSGWSQEVARPDAYFPPRADAFVPLPDAGPPTCFGTPTPCASRSDNCTDGEGCRVQQCSGSGTCAWLSTETCSVLPGCYVDGGRCMGIGRCQDINFSPSCFRAQCEWNDSFGRCGGVAASCASLSGAACLEQPGCMSLLDAGPVDAGPADAGPLPDVGSDAGPLDAGPAPLCTPRGSCDPADVSSCPAGRVCAGSIPVTTCRVPTSVRGTEGTMCAASADCLPGLICTDGRGGRACLRACRPGRPLDCRAGTTCGPAHFNDACLRRCVQDCDLYDNDCPSGETCVRFTPNPDEPAIQGCLNPGFGELGEACTSANACVRGAACIDGSCQQLCLTTAECTTGSCVASSEGITHCE